MDVVKLLRDARMAGVRVEAKNGELRIEATKRQQDWCDRLAPYKAELLSILRTNGHVNGSPLPRIRPATDLANGERFADQYGDRVRYCHTWRQWYIWNNRRWQPDSTGEVMRFAKATAKRILVEAANAPDDDCKELTRHAQASQARPRLEAMLALAESEQPIPTEFDAFDSDPWLLNFENGTVDMRPGKLRPHDRADLITKSTLIEFPDDLAAESALWIDFLTSTFDGKAGVIDYLHRLLGSALVGIVREHVLPIGHGGGSNGKTVFINTVQAAMGDYALTAPPNLLMTKRNEQHPCEIADLYGKRLVVVSETRDGQRLDEGLVKTLTGGDTIRARRMRENFWQFRPSHMPFLMTNHRPIVRGTDHGIWRRLRLIPFTVTVPEQCQDKLLPEKLAAELPAIAAWLVRGCLLWQQHGLDAPEEVLLATDAYKTESDTFAQWFQERVILEPSSTCRAADAFANYQKWGEDAGERNLLSRRRFGERITDHDIAKRVSNGTWYDGMTLLSA